MFSIVLLFNIFVMPTYAYVHIWTYVPTYLHMYLPRVKFGQDKSVCFAIVHFPSEILQYVMWS
jgi:hypothetical protein